MAVKHAKCMYLFDFLLAPFTGASVGFGVLHRKFIERLLAFSCSFLLTFPFKATRIDELGLNDLRLHPRDSNCKANKCNKENQLPPVAPPVSMAFLTFSWSSQRRSVNPDMSEVDCTAARSQKQEKWCQCGTFPSNMGDCGKKDSFIFSCSVQYQQF